jgi:hypothetical protein
MASSSPWSPQLIADLKGFAPELIGSEISTDEQTTVQSRC